MQANFPPFCNAFGLTKIPQATEPLGEMGSTQMALGCQQLADQRQIFWRHHSAANVQVRCH